MSGKRSRPRARLRPHHALTSPFQSLKPTPPPLELQVRSCIKAIDKMAAMLGELDLMVEFTMRQFKLQRPVAGGLILTGSKPQMESLSLLDLYIQQREAFAATLMEERNAFARAQAASQGQHPGNGHDTGPDTVNGHTLDFGDSDDDNANAAGQVNDVGVIRES